MKSYAPTRSAPTPSGPTAVPSASPTAEGAVPTPPAAIAPANRPTLRRGSTGEAVRVVQQSLNEHGASLEVDGIFGRGTDGAVRTFQADHGLKADGIVGALSWAAMLPEGYAEQQHQQQNDGSQTGAGGQTDWSQDLDEGGTGTGTGTTTGTGTGTTTGTGTGTTTTGTGPTTGAGTGTGTGTTGPQPQGQQAPDLAAYMAGLATLPRGSAMSAEQRAEMYRLTASMTIVQIRTCFEHRFGHPMVDDTGTWTVALARAVWAQLDTLPDGHVTENTILTTFRAISGTTSYGPSWEAPTQLNTIQIGAGNNPAHIAHTVRHEVGHAVHADSNYMGTINAWLQSDVKFWFFPTGEGGLRQWVDDLGGLGGMSGDHQTKFVSLLSSYVGNGSSWNPARATFTTGLSAEDTAVYNEAPERIRNAIDASPGSWYSNYQNFAPGAKGKYFLNYWYQRGFYMGPAAEAAVTATGDDYTAMSEKEFFANCYAEYFKDPAGYTNPAKWGGSLPSSVKAFFQAHILERQPYTPPAQTPTAGASPSPAEAPPKPTGMPGTP